MKGVCMRLSYLCQTTELINEPLLLKAAEDLPLDTGKRIQVNVVLPVCVDSDVVLVEFVLGNRFLNIKQCYGARSISCASYANSNKVMQLDIAKMNQAALNIPSGTKRLNKGELINSVTEKELLSTVWGVNHFRFYLYGKPFTVNADSSNRRTQVDISYVGLCDSANTVTLWPIVLEKLDEMQMYLSCIVRVADIAVEETC
ncbi:hypothetical protein PR048_011338 [Dryococelus australis]|uniref:Reverse transcriptase RNase H-like domain-containing protein n=1 Tax=Dryococelus australis TaxID=614101 RepID=A0ABQ9HLN5_9NEOP|nr:hypothetical protein PR048_011338 [Dryococelus australis]